MHDAGALLTAYSVNMSDDSILGGGDGAFETNQASSVGDVDGWIESLMSCKQLSEADVLKLCEKVCRSYPVATRAAPQERCIKPL